jgi:photosynthetic reaction center cytochrome c subunit
MKWLFRLAVGVVLLVVTGNVVKLIDGVAFHGDHPPVDGVQRGFRGTGLVLVYSPQRLAQLRAVNQIPVTVPYAGGEGEKASTVFRNVQVLRDVNAGEFIRLMVSMTKWVAPDQGCAACHNVDNFASDGIYRKVVARRMLQMVRHINTDWTHHVGQTGVVCYTCHRGPLVPPHVWFNDPGPQQAGGFAQGPIGKNHPSPAADGAALPLDPFTNFLDQHDEIRVQSTTALPTGNRQSLKQAEWTYSLMLSFTQGLGVNCDFCHNTRAFGDWSQSPPQRVTAWYGIRMVRDLNNNFLEPLRSVFPPNRLGPVFADSPKVYCATCHNGVYKPLFGVSIAKDFPELRGAPAR